MFRNKFCTRTIILTFFLLFALNFAATAHASPFATRAPGVYPGMFAVYDVWAGNSQFVLRLDVNNVSGTMVGVTESLVVNNTLLLPYGPGTSYMNVAGYSFEIPPFIIAGNMNTGNPEYPGSSLTLHQSILGHIVLGQYRQTMWEDNSDRAFGIIEHAEFDRQTGLMISYVTSSNDLGVAYQLKYTNAWGSNLFWFGLEAILTFLRFILPFVIIILVWYFMSFFIFAMADYFRVRSRKKSTSLKMGNMMWFQIKILIIAMLIFMAIFLFVILVIIPLILGAFH